MSGQSAQQPDYRELLKQAFLSIEKLHNQVQQLERAQHAPIAIIGMSCRFPGADNPAAFEQLLLEGRDATTEVPDERWDAEAYYDPNPDTPGKTYVRRGGFLRNVDQFEPQFFGISPREAKSMDPQQRLLLETSWEAIEAAGHVGADLRGSRTGVYVGLISNDYGQLASGLEDLDHYFGTGNAASIAAGRIAFCLGLAGPTLTIDTACSSSLVAIHLAAQALRMRECDMALAGGANLMLTPTMTIITSRGRMLSPDGRCKAFDASADGYGRGEGCAMVALRRLDDALADGDPILAVLRGTAVNQDGRSGGLTVPSGPAQEVVLRSALADAGLKPNEIQYVEAHGTGTQLGDPIELRAIDAVYGSGSGRSQPLWVGSAKTNIGHTEATAGIAGLMKAIVALSRGVIPAHLHLANPSPDIPWASLNVTLPTQTTRWDSPIRRAGVSAFGFSGTNAHAVLEQAPAMPVASAPIDRPTHVFPLSARSEPALKQLAAALAQHVARHPEQSLADVAHTLGVGRTHFACRAAIVAPNSAEFIAGLQALASSKSTTNLIRPKASSPTSKLGMLFSNSSVGWTAIQALAKLQPIVADALARSAELFKTTQQIDLHAPSESRPAEWARVVAEQFALSELFAAWKIAPAVSIGAGLGEVMAAQRAGVFTPEQAIHLAAALMNPSQASELAALVAAGSTSLRCRFFSTRLGREVAPRELMQAVYWLPLTNGAELLDSRVPELGPLPCEQLIAIGDAHSGSIAASGGSPPQCTIAAGGSGSLWPALMHALGHLYVAGFDIDWPAIDRPFRRQKQILPTYPFQRQRYWVDYAPAALHPRRQAAEVDRVGEQLYELAWELQENASPLPSEAGSRMFIVFSEDADFVWALKQRVSDDEVAMVVPSPKFRDEPGKRVALDGNSAEEVEILIDMAYASAAKRGDVRLEFVFAWPASVAQQENSLATLHETYRIQCTALLNLVHALAKLPASFAYRLWIVTRDVCPAHAADDDGPALSAAAPLTGAPLWGLGRVIAAEAPQFDCRLIDLSVPGPGAPQADDWQPLLRELLAPSRETQLSLSARWRHVARLQRFSAGPTEAVPSRTVVRPDGSYLITGGLGAIGMHVATWLVERGAKSLVLVSRRAPSSETASAIDTLRKGGAKVEVCSADVSNAAEVARLVERFGADLPTLRGVFHAAGVLDDKLLVQQDWSAIETVLLPKLTGAWRLHEATLGQSLDWFVLCSSSAALFGSPGQANYAAANATLDAFASYRRSLGLPALSIQWGAWAGEGMASRDQSEARRRRAAKFVLPLEPAIAIQALERLLIAAADHACVIDCRWDQLAADFADTPLPPLVAELVDRSRRPQPIANDSARVASGVAAAAAAIQPVNRMEALRGLAAAEQLASIETLVLEGAAQILGLPTDQIALDGSLLELGVDSLMMIELANLLRQQLAVAIQLHEVLERPTVRGVAAGVHAQLLRTNSLAGSAATGQAPQSPIEQRLAEIWTEVTGNAILDVDLPLAAAPESAARFAARMKQELQVDLPADEIGSVSLAELALIVVEELVNRAN